MPWSRLAVTFQQVVPAMRQGIAMTLVLGSALPVWAQGTWPPYAFSAEHTIDRGPGGYLSWIKLGLLWLLFLAWVKTTDWVSEDCQKANVPYALWVPIVFFPLLVALLLLGFVIAHVCRDLSLVPGRVSRAADCVHRGP